jgi:hypothetical protein
MLSRRNLFSLVGCGAVFMVLWGVAMAVLGVLSTAGVHL